MIIFSQLQYIDVEITPYDMIRIIKTLEHVQGRTALMGYSNIVNCAKSICEVLEYDIDMFTISSEDEVERVLLEKQNNSVFCQSILDKSPCLIYATDKQNQLIYTNRKPKDRTAPSLDFVLSHFHPETESSSLLSFGDGLWHLYCENLLLNSRRNVTVYYLNRTQFSRPAEKIPLSVIRELPSDVAGKFYSDSNPGLNMHSKYRPMPEADILCFCQAKTESAKRPWHTISIPAGKVPENPCLREIIHTLDGIMGLLISDLNIQLGTQVVGFRKNALEALKQYPWEGNFPQFTHVLRNLILFSHGAYISAEEVNGALAREREQTQSTLTYALSLNGTLDEITDRIIMKVLQEEDMNQTKAAKRLGISRATLWRRIGHGI